MEQSNGHTLLLVSVPVTMQVLLLQHAFLSAATRFFQWLYQCQKQFCTPLPHLSPLHLHLSRHHVEHIQFLKHLVLFRTPEHIGTVQNPSDMKSRAEQSRAEQSRAEHGQCLTVNGNVKTKNQKRKPVKYNKDK
jgi:hypothetical protein